MTKNIQKAHHYPEVGCPLFWPLGIAVKLGQQAFRLNSRNMKFLNEVVKTEVVKPRPEWSNENKALYSLHTFTLRDFSSNSAKQEIPVLILPPYAGHTSVIADFQKGQSLAGTLLEQGIQRLLLTDWHSATREMKDYDVSNYLAELHVAVSDLGGRVNLIGLCQGGWMAALYAARYPQSVASLVLAGSPIDTQAGNGAIKEYANTLPFSFYKGLVSTGGGLLKGAYMLEGFKSLHPSDQYIKKYIDLYEHIEDPDYVKRTENFERWYEYTLDLPGKWYLQVVKELFRENRFVKGQFTALGKVLDPKAIKCPLYLLAGMEDDITPKEQVYNAENYFGTPKAMVTKDLALGGHIGLFMGTKALSINWPKISAWLSKQK